MTDTFDAVLADMLGESTLFLHEITDYHTRLAAAHAAEVAERDARIAELETDLAGMIDGNAYACQRAEAAERDARQLPVAAPWKQPARLEVTVREDGKPEITCTGWLLDGKGTTPTRKDFLAAVCRWIVANTEDDRPAFDEDAAIATTEQADED